MIEVAATLQGETRVRFLVGSLRMLVRQKEKSVRFTAIRMSNLVPVGVTSDGGVVAAVAIDYAYWDATAAGFAQRKDPGAKKRTLLVAGKASRQATQEMHNAGITMIASQRQ